jgi:hypothetical protein
MSGFVENNHQMNIIKVMDLFLRGPRSETHFGTKNLIIPLDGDLRHFSGIK